MHSKHFTKQVYSSFTAPKALGTSGPPMVMLHGISHAFAVAASSHSPCKPPNNEPAKGEKKGWRETLKRGGDDGGLGLQSREQGWLIFRCYSGVFGGDWAAQLFFHPLFQLLHRDLFCTFLFWVFILIFVGIDGYRQPGFNLKTTAAKKGV